LTEGTLTPKLSRHLKHDRWHHITKNIYFWSASWLQILAHDVISIEREYEAQAVNTFELYAYETVHA
jgi:hypothetical protein